MTSPYLPHEAEVVERVQESPTIFTLRVRFVDPEIHRAYEFQPGQFNMVYHYGVGEIPISIVSDPAQEDLYDHTIRVVGRVTGAMDGLQARHRIGIRGPYGRGWPLSQAEGHDILVLTGGLGCAPVVSVINYVTQRRQRYGRMVIMQGVKHSEDLIWRERYQQWAQVPDTQVVIAADQGGPLWPWHVGRVTDLFDKVVLEPSNTIAMMCGPEGMMRVAVDRLLALGMASDHLYMSMERSMHCAVGHCGHCQYGAKFVCRDGPVFCYPDIEALFGVKGF